MNCLSLLTCGFCSVLLVTGAGAAEVTLENCLQRAAKTNSGLKAFEMVQEAAEHNKDLNRAAFFPQVKMKAVYSLADQPGRLVIKRDDFGPGLPEENVDLADDHLDNYQARLNVLQPVFTGGNLSHTYARSLYQLQSAESTYLYQRDLLQQDVKKIFYEALAAHVQVTAAGKGLHARESAMRLTGELLAEGYAKKEDLLVAGVALTEAEANLVLARNQADMAMTKLRRLIQASPEEPLEPAGELFKLRVDAPLHEFFGAVESDRHDIKAMQFQARQSNEDVGIAGSGLYPSVAMEGGYLRQRESNVADPAVWSVMLSAEWNVFDWGKTDADVKRATALNRRDAYNLEELKKAAILEVEDLWRQAGNELSHLLSIEARLKSAELALENTLSRRREGKARQADVFAGEALLWQEYGDYYRSAALLHGVIAGLERASGKPAESFILRTPLYKIDFSGTAERIAAVADVHGAARVEESKTQPAHLAAEIPAAPIGVGKTGNLACRLQLGAFSQKANAEKMLAGINLQVASKLQLSIIAEKGLFKVVSGEFVGKDAAVQAAQEVGVGDYIMRL